jgi:hypothetical protein
MPFNASTIHIQWIVKYIDVIFEGNKLSWQLISKKLLLINDTESEKQLNWLKI